MNKKAFTLVELIVVITILAVLGTIAFISFQDYVVNARDSKRSTDIKNIEKALELSKLQTGVYPIPGEAKAITFSGATAWKQGEFNNDVTRVVRNFKEAPKDPLVDTFYGYSVTKNRGEYQLGAVLEESDYGTSANGKLAAAYVKGNYNGKTVKVSTGSTTYILGAPSILTSDLNETDLIDIINAKKLVYKGHQNLPASYTGTTYDLNGGFDFSPATIVAYEGDLASVDSNTLVDNLQQIYTGTVISEEPDIEVIFSEDKDLATDIVLGKKPGSTYTPDGSTGGSESGVIEHVGNFKLLDNGIVTCNGATAGETSTLGGKQYTAVSTQNLIDKIGSNDLMYYEGICTSLVTKMNYSIGTPGSEFGMNYVGVFNNLFGSPDISHWDTSSVTDMSYMFKDAMNFNSALNFDTSSVVNMEGMFQNARSFNQPINFDTKLVENMSYMFDGANSFNQAIDFDAIKVTDMNNMLRDALSFNSQLTLKNTGLVVDMSYMFRNASIFNQPINFQTDSVTNMRAMFRNARAFNSSINFTNTQKVLDMKYMFRDAASFNQPLNFDTSTVADMGYMFREATSFNQPLNFDTSSVTSMDSMFREATSFNQPLNFNTNLVTTMDSMFREATSFNQPLNFNTSSVTDIGYMFRDANSFNQNLSGWTFGTGVSTYSFDQNTTSWLCENKPSILVSCG